MVYALAQVRVAAEVQRYQQRHNETGQALERAKVDCVKTLSWFCGRDEEQLATIDNGFIERADYPINVFKLVCF